MPRRFYLSQYPAKKTRKIVSRNVVIAVASVIALALIILLWPPAKAPDTTAISAMTATSVEHDNAIENAVTEIPAETQNDTTAIQIERVTNEPESETTTAQVIRIQVLNGCGVKGLGRKVSPALRAMGFDVREVRNAKSFKHEKSSVINRSGYSSLAFTVADSIGIDSVLVTSETNEDLIDIDVTLVVGADYEKLRLGMSAGN